MGSAAAKTLTFQADLRLEGRLLARVGTIRQP
jgi:hypothetical protein